MDAAIDLIAAVRLLLVYAHLLLCVFALHGVISTDWRLLRGHINAPQLLQTHHRMVLLLAGLWFTGLVLVAIDTGFDATALASRPKLLAKLACVALLTLNGVLLRAWCFPRLASRRYLSRVEAMAVMVCGAVSTTSWLMAAFFGTARPLQQLSLAQCLAFYWVALALALPVALLLEARLRSGRGRAPDLGSASGAGTDAPAVVARFRSA